MLLVGCYPPESDRTFWAFGRGIFEEEALDRKTKELIALAVSSILRCRHCMRAHVQGAFKAGARKGDRRDTRSALGDRLWGAGRVEPGGLEEHLRSHAGA